MASEKQIRANKLNSNKSKGPKSDKGKAISAKNAIKHGLFSVDTLLPWEKATDLENLRMCLDEALLPEGQLEELLLDKIVSLAWRLRRVGRIETGLMFLKRCELVRQREHDDVERAKESLPSEIKRELDFNKIKRNNTQWALMNNADLFDLGIVFTENTGTISNLQRYEVSLERSLYKALHELQRIQAVRNGEKVLPPIAIDMQGEATS